MQYFEKKIKEGKEIKKVEIVIVSDGSKDNTPDIVKEYSLKYTTDSNIVVRGIVLIQNQGKGAAVKYVMKLNES